MGNVNIMDVPGSFGRIGKLVLLGLSCSFLSISALGTTNIRSSAIDANIQFEEGDTGTCTLQSNYLKFQAAVRDSWKFGKESFDDVKSPAEITKGDDLDFIKINNVAPSGKTFQSITEITSNVPFTNEKDTLTIDPDGTSVLGAKVDVVFTAGQVISTTGDIGDKTEVKFNNESGAVFTISPQGQSDNYREYELRFESDGFDTGDIVIKNAKEGQDTILVDTSNIKDKDIVTISAAGAIVDSISKTADQAKTITINDIKVTSAGSISDVVPITLQILNDTVHSSQLANTVKLGNIKVVDNTNNNNELQGGDGKLPNLVFARTKEISSSSESSSEASNWSEDSYMILTGENYVANELRLGKREDIDESQGDLGGAKREYKYNDNFNLQFESANQQTISFSSIQANAVATGIIGSNESGKPTVVNLYGEDVIKFGDNCQELHLAGNLNLVNKLDSNSPKLEVGEDKKLYLDNVKFEYNTGDNKYLPYINLNGGTLKLQGNLSYAGTDNLESDQQLIKVLADSTLEVGGNGLISIPDTSSAHAICITNGNLSICNDLTIKGGKFNNGSAGRGIYVNGGTTLTLKPVDSSVNVNLNDSDHPSSIELKNGATLRFGFTPNNTIGNAEEWQDTKIYASSLTVAPENFILPSGENDKITIDLNDLKTYAKYTENDDQQGYANKYAQAVDGMFTAKDDAGNAILRIVNMGEPTEVPLLNLTKIQRANNLQASDEITVTSSQTLLSIDNAIKYSYTTTSGDDETTIVNKAISVKLGAYRPTTDGTIYYGLTLVNKDVTDDTDEDSIIEGGSGKENGNPGVGNDNAGNQANGNGEQPQNGIVNIQTALTNSWRNVNQNLLTTTEFNHRIAFDIASTAYNTIYNHLDIVRDTKFSVWASAVGQIGRSSTSENYKMSNDIYGFILGADSNYSENFSAGVFFGYVKGDAKQKYVTDQDDEEQNNDDTLRYSLKNKPKSYYGGIYARWVSLDETLSAKLVALVGRIKHKEIMPVYDSNIDAAKPQMNLLDETETAKHNSNVYGIGLDVTYTPWTFSNFKLGPWVAISCTQSKIKAYERLFGQDSNPATAGNARNPLLAYANYEKAKTCSTEIILGLATEYAAGPGKLSLKLGWAHDVRHNTTNTKSKVLIYQYNNDLTGRQENAAGTIDGLELKPSRVGKNKFVGKVSYGATFGQIGINAGLLSNLGNKWKDVSGGITASYSF